MFGGVLCYFSKVQCAPWLKKVGKHGFRRSSGICGN